MENKLNQVFRRITNNIIKILLYHGYDKMVVTNLVFVWEEGECHGLYVNGAAMQGMEDEQIKNAFRYHATGGFLLDRLRLLDGVNIHSVDIVADGDCAAIQEVAIELFNDESLAESAVQLLFYRFCNQIESSPQLLLPIRLVQLPMVLASSDCNFLLRERVRQLSHLSATAFLRQI
jgi:hypothetical protein